MTDIIIITFIVVILGLAIGYIIHAKRKGKKCIGCPNSCCCSAKNKSCNSSHNITE